VFVFYNRFVFVVVFCEFVGSRFRVCVETMWDLRIFLVWLLVDVYLVYVDYLLV